MHQHVPHENTNHYITCSKNYVISNQMKFPRNQNSFTFTTPVSARPRNILPLGQFQFHLASNLLYNFLFSWLSACQSKKKTVLNNPTFVLVKNEIKTSLSPSFALRLLHKTFWQSFKKLPSYYFHPLSSMMQKLFLQY